MIVQVNWKGYEKLAFIDQYLALFRKLYSSYNGRCMDLSNGAISNYLE